MFQNKTDLAIVNRSFWPKSQVLGEALLQYAELSSIDKSVCVITQEENLKENLLKKNRGKNLSVYSAKSYTTSASSLIKRAAESFYFMGWTLTSLIQSKPAIVYVSTNPPVIVPFIVAVYCQITGSKYIYHLQDIHPEATNIVLPLNKIIFESIKKIDNYTLRNAKVIITLSEDMKRYIENRTKTSAAIHLLDNPSFDVTPIPKQQRNKDIIFCGNAGRLQRIPLLISAIKEYLDNGGKLSFTFAGGGVYSSDIETLSKEYEKVNYLGFIPGDVAADEIRQHKWSLLPIDDEVTQYAFPSKSSGYALSGSGILAICGSNTSVARWVEKHKIGIVCKPEVDSLVKCLFELENKDIDLFNIDLSMREKLKIPYFARKLKSLTFDNYSQ